MKNVLLVICFFLLTFNWVYASENLDVINLKDGTMLKGEILETNDNFVIIKTSLGEIKIEREKIKITPVTIYLKDDNIIKGNLIKRNETSVNVETSLGSFEIELNNIKKMIEETNSSVSPNTNLTTNTQNDTEMGIKAIGNAFLYQQRQKKISTALGFQALGAGLLYSEKYTMGTIMLLAENGLLISGTFVNDPEIVPYLWISGIALKAVNTFFTIKSVNDYNNKLANEMGIGDGINSKEIRIKTRKGYFYVAPSIGLSYGGYVNESSLDLIIGYGNKKIGRIGIDYNSSFQNNTQNFTLQYEKPISTRSILSFTPKLGLGFISSSYYESPNSIGPVTSVSGFGIVVGCAAEFELSKLLIIKIGYDLFLGFEKDSSNSSLLATLGFKI